MALCINERKCIFCRRVGLENVLSILGCDEVVFIFIPIEPLDFEWQYSKCFEDSLFHERNKTIKALAIFRMPSSDFLESKPVRNNGIRAFRKEQALPDYQSWYPPLYY